MKRQSSRNIADILSEYVKESHLEEGLFKVKVSDAWDRVVEAELGPFYLPEQIPSLTVSRSYSGRVLKCTMASSVVRSQLRSRSACLVSSINSILGGEFVEKIILV